jgi:putative flippase GtrA
MNVLELSKKCIISLKKNNFIKYLITGINSTILSTFLLWLFVDLMNLLASVMSIVISFFIFFFKFFFYKKTKMFNNNKNNFTKYCLIWILVTFLNAFLLWLFVDFMKFWVVIINPFTTLLIFTFRFVLFKYFKMLS